MDVVDGITGVSARVHQGVQLMAQIVEVDASSCAVIVVAVAFSKTGADCLQGRLQLQRR